MLLDTPIAAAPKWDPTTEAKVNILLVDDRPDKLLSLRVLLEDLQQNVVSATSGKEALRQLLKEDFAVILLDVNMPGMDGFETAALIRQRARSETTPIIFVSAINNTETHVSRGYSLGAVDYIHIPVVPEILRAKVMVFVDLFRKSELIRRQAEEHAAYLQEQTARAAAEAEQERLAFLAEASNVLSATLDYQRTFENFARLVVPRLADFCIIDVLGESGALQQLAVAHRDPAAEAELRGLECLRNFPARHGASRVFASGRPELCPHLTDDKVDEYFEDPAARALIRDLHPVSYVAVPLLARDRTLGTITLVSTTDGNIFSPRTLALAESLAQRATLALDNANLYKAAHEARLEAERANKAKDQFLAMLSHELRTPLMPVLTTVLGLEEHEELPESLRPQLQLIRRNVELETRLIDDLLDLTGIARGKLRLHYETVDAHVLLRAALEICSPEMQAKGLHVEVELNASLVSLAADPARLQQIFWNLLKNAVKFTPGGGRIVVRTRNPNPHQLEIEVHDDGMGIEPDLLPRIFDAFEQGERLRFGGLGLGLAITKALVELHKGRITAASAGREEGSTFLIALPIGTAAEITSLPAPRPPAVAASRGSLRILLVEDNEDTNASLTWLFKRRGYHVASAHDVRAALRLSAEADFDVLISDMGLPDGNGLQVIEELTAKNPSIYAIALSGFGMEDDIRKSHEAGFRHHLVKPVDVNKLDALIRPLAGGNERAVPTAPR